MPTYFCGSCGKAIPYSITKPTSCPACGKLTKMTVVTASPVPIPVLDSSPSYQVVVPNQKGKVSKRYNVISERENPSHAQIAEEDLADSSSFDENEGDEGPLSEAYDVNAAKQLAQELIAGIDPSTIHIGREDRDDDRPVKFGDLVRQREAQAGKQ